jgi:ATP-dependent HslUV protease subunit HslV
LRRSSWPRTDEAEAIVRRSLDIAADVCVYTNRNVTIETLSA